MKKIITFMASFIASFFLHAQEFYVNQENGDIALINLSSCSHRVIANIPTRIFPFSSTGYGDITFTRDGKLYGVTINGRLHQINLNTRDTTFLASCPNTGLLAFNSMVSNAQGIIYIANSIGDLFSFDPATRIVRLLGTIPFGAAGDLIFHKNKLYMAAVDNKLIEVNLNNPRLSNVYMNFSISSSVFGIVSFSPNCQEVKSYAITENSTVYEIDFVNRRLILVCVIPTQVAIFGAASQLEFNAAAAINIAQVNFQNADCGRTDGTIDVTASGGLGTLQYSLDGINFQPQSQFTSLRNGTYRVRIRDTEGCNADTIITLAGQGEPIITLLRTTPNACGTTNNGHILVNATPPNNTTITYSIDSVNFTSSGNFSNLLSGNYTVFVRSSNNCVLSLPLVIYTLPRPIISNIQVTNTSCAKPNGKLEITSNNNGTVHFYSLDSLRFQNSGTFENLLHGNYDIYVKDSANCFTRGRASIDSSIKLKINDLQIQHTTCGDTNGSIRVNASWTNGNSNNIFYQLNSNVLTTQSFFTNLSGQPHLLKISGMGGVCADSVLIDVKKSNPITTQGLRIQDANCDENNGFIRIIAKGNGKLVYKLGDTNFENEDIFRNLGKGKYEITLRDTQNCMLKVSNIMLSQSCFVFIPNAFSPNEDALNDYFTIFGSNEYVKKINLMRIFNRFGDLVFEAKDFSCNQPQEGWNGKMNDKILSPDVFVYYAEVEFLDNTVKIFKGDVTLLK